MVELDRGKFVFDVWRCWVGNVLGYTHESSKLTILRLAKIKKNNKKVIAHDRRGTKAQEGYGKWAKLRDSDINNEIRGY
jgi:hypothetical protein